MFKIDVRKLSGLNTESRKKKFVGAIAIAEEVINGDRFKQWFLSQHFSQLSESEPSLVGRTNLQLLDLLLRTASFDYYVQKKPWYKRFTSVMGWEDSSGVYTYGDIFDGMSLYGLAGHLVHEATHQLGFSHSFNWSYDRDNSVSYKVGNYVEAQQPL